ncbi:MAG: DUF721 domain-containing protein [Bacteroidota bacterium]
MRKPKPESVAAIIQRLIDDLGLKKRYDQERIVQQWSEIVGERIARRAEAMRIENGKLYVNVDRPTWRNELILRKRDILKQINAVMKHEVVKDIIFR